MLNRKFRWILLVVICAGIVLIAGCAPGKPIAAPKKTRPLLVDSKLKPGKAQKVITPPALKLEVMQKKIQLRWADKEGTQMVALARSSNLNEVTQTGTLLDFSAKLYDNGKLSAYVSAPLATADYKKKVVVASGGVVLKSLVRQTVVNSSWIKWYVDKHKIVGDGGVKIKSASGSVDGAAFVADTALKTLKVMDSGRGLEY